MTLFDTFGDGDKKLNAAERCRSARAQPNSGSLEARHG
jgi:hypothetical protein